MIGICSTCKQEKKIVQRVFLNEGDEEPASQYCKDCFDEIAPYRRHLSVARKNEILENAAKKIQAQRFDFYLER